jgi:16S rRNA (adenine1518-N6/adenine1519-N6)-dimethyltransferase
VTPFPARPPAARRYGQHHLVDAGTLQAILALADVQPHDVILEVGAADGLLTRPLAARAAAVHAFEVDLRFGAALQALQAEVPGVQVHLADAMKADLGALTPAPTALVANLAYNIAIPLIVRSLDELPTIGRWAVMLQKELADRLFAAPRTKPYSAVSVLVQLCCELRARRAVPPTVFWPRPRVDSAFVVFERRHDASLAVCRAVGPLVRQAFAQRRKMLANALAGALPPQAIVAPPDALGADGSGAAPNEGARGWVRPRAAVAGGAATREAVAGALTALGLPAAARAEELAPPQFVQLAQKLGWL